MTRFNIELNQAVNLSISCLQKMLGGELFVPKLKSYNVMQLAKAINPKNKIKYIGLRPGEKLHEEMISSIDSLNTFDLGKLFAIIDPHNLDLNKKYTKYKKLKKYFSYNSFDNTDYLSNEEIKKIIKKYY